MSDAGSLARRDVLRLIGTGALGHETLVGQTAGAANLRSIDCGQTRQSELTDDDDTHYPCGTDIGHGYYEPVTFDGTNGCDITARIERLTEPTEYHNLYLSLVDPEGNVVAENDFAYTTDQNPETVTHTIQTTGEYTIRAGGACAGGDDRTFPYELTVECDCPGAVFEASTQTAGTAAPGETVGLEFSVTNTGETAGDLGLYVQGKSETGTHNADIYGDAFEIVGRNDDGGEWLFEGWEWENVQPGATREPSLELAVGESVEAGEYTFAIDVVADDQFDDPEERLTPTVTVEPASEAAIELTAEADSVDPGEPGVIEFSITNTGERAFEDLTIGPDGEGYGVPLEWRMDEGDADGGRWTALCLNPGGCYQGHWVFDSRQSDSGPLEPGETRQPTLAFRVPEDIDTDTVTIAAVGAGIGDGTVVRDTATATVVIDETPDSPPEIETRSIRLSQFAVERGTDHPTIEVQVQGAELVELEVDFLDETIPLERHEEDDSVWSATIPTPDAALSPGTWVDLSIRATNRAGTTLLDAVSTEQIAIDEDEIFSAEGLAVTREDDRFGYAVCNEILDVVVTPVAFEGEAPIRERGAGKRYEEYRYWKLAVRLNLARYFSGPRGSMGEVGFNVTIADNDGEFYRIQDEYSTFREKEERIVFGDDGVDSLFEAAEDVIHSAITDGEFDAWVLTHLNPSVAISGEQTSEEADDSDVDNVRGRTRPDGRVYVSGMFGTPTELNTWYHELGHVYRLEHLYQYGNVHDECVMGNDTREETTAVPEVPPMSTPVRIADTLGLDNEYTTNDAITDWLTVEETVEIGTDIDANTTEQIELSYLTEYDHGDPVKTVTVGDATYVLEARRHLDGYEDGESAWTSDGASVVVYRHRPGFLPIGHSLDMLENDGQRTLSTPGELLVDSIGGVTPYQVRFRLDAIDASGATVAVELTLPNSREIVLEETPAVSWSLPHNEISYTPPTLSLHVEDSQGRVVGYNDSGQYVNEIPAARASGPRVGGPEWVVVPAAAAVDVSVSSANLEAFAAEMAAADLSDIEPDATVETLESAYRTSVTAYPEDATLIEENGELVVPGAETAVDDGVIGAGRRERSFNARQLPVETDASPVDESSADGDGRVPDWLPLAGAGAVGLGGGTYWYLTRDDDQRDNTR